jgi:lysophospholipase L1-like esterase
MRVIAVFRDAMSRLVATRRPAAKQIIVLGDSFTSAYGVTAEQSWAAIYADRLGCDLANLAIEGATSDALINKAYTWPSGRSQSQLAEALSLIGEAPSRNIRAVAVGIGINDWLWLQDPETSERCAVVQSAACENMFTASLENLGDNLGRILADLQPALEPGTHLIVMTYCMVWNAEKSDAINSAILSAIGDHGDAILADLREPFAGRENVLLQDTVHPSIAGHTVIADVFSNVTPPVTDSTAGF